jgi:hypothetical protein
MPFGLGDGLALTVAYVIVEPQAILKLHVASKCYNKIGFVSLADE